MTDTQHENPYIIDDTGFEYEIDPHSRFTVPPMINGSKPTDNGNLIIEAADYDAFIQREPAAKKYIRRYIGSDEFIHNKMRYCLWLVDCPPNELKSMKLVYERVKACRQFRLKSVDASTRRAADRAWLFQAIRQPASDYICVPRVSSELRRYIPMSWVSKDVIAGDAVQCIPNATLWLFGMLESSVHMAWMRVVAGRLRNDYRYSGSIVYNNFAFVNADKKRWARIEAAAQGILDARAKFPDASLADLYDETIMPVELRAAHNENDAAVLDAYGYPADWNETQIVNDLLYRYEALRDGNDLSKIAATSRRNFIK